MASINKNTAVVRTPSDQLEVSVHTTYEEHPMSQVADKSHEPLFKGSVEGREEKEMSPSSSVEATV